MSREEAYNAKFLNWLADRLVHVYGESPCVDFVQATQRIANELATSRAEEYMKIAQPYRSPGEYQAYLMGVSAVAQAFGYDVDSKSWGGGIPMELTLVAGPGVPKQSDDVYDQEAENAEIPDAATEPDSEGPSSDGEQSAPS